MLATTFIADVGDAINTCGGDNMAIISEGKVNLRWRFRRYCKLMLEITGSEVSIALLKICLQDY